MTGEIDLKRNINKRQKIARTAWQNINPRITIPLKVEQGSAMQERQFAIATPSGNMDTFIVHPSAGGSHPAVVLYMDVWGMREDIRECAEATAEFVETSCNEQICACFWFPMLPKTSNELG